MQKKTSGMVTGNGPINVKRILLLLLLSFSFFGLVYAQNQSADGLPALVPDQNGKYPITPDTLAYIHIQNTNGSADKAFSVLSRLHTEKYVTGFNTQRTGEQNFPLTEAAGKQVITKIPQSNLDQQNVYLRFLTVENAFYRGLYGYSFNGAEAMLKENLRADEGRLLLYYYALSANKTRWRVSVAFDDVNQYIPGLENPARNAAMIYLSGSSLAGNDFENAFFYLEETVAPVSEELLKAFYEFSLSSNDPNVFWRIRNAAADENIKALVLARYSELQKNRSEDADIISLLSRQERLVTDSFTASVLNDAVMLRQLATGFSPTKIGVLLPFSYTKFAGVVSDVLSGLTMALDESGKPFELVFEDTALDPATAERKARKLIFEDNVAAVIGPLSRLNSERVAAIADRFNVPFISLSKKPELGKNHTHFFRMQENRETKLIRLIDYFEPFLTGVNLSILYNPTLENIEKTSFINRRLLQQGLPAASLYKIDPRQRDFRDVFDKVSGQQVYADDEERQDESIDLQITNSVSGVRGIVLVMVKPKQFLSITNYVKIYGMSNYIIATDEYFPELMTAKDIIPQMIFTDTLYRENNQDLEAFYFSHWQHSSFNSPPSEASSYVYYSYNALKLLTALLGTEGISRVSLNDKLNDNAVLENILPGFTNAGDGELIRKANIYRAIDPSVAF